MRRVWPEEVTRGAEHLETGFAATMDDEVFAAEAAAGTLCSLGREWAFVQLALTGRRHGPGDAAGLVVLGGKPLGVIGPSGRDMIIVLPPDQVARAAEYLRGVDPATLVGRHRAALAERAGGELPAAFAAEIERHAANLRHFYAAAAGVGQAVAKRTYR
ncbi:DUF1877 family protein [Actinoplanes sp. CA-142083]|uniref:DUF1877 family protein n=1 Tax=Actinoplanes sp. CA-142083 TaxID=3239903 RepID=UPI003D8D9AD0